MKCVGRHLLAEEQDERLTACEDPPVYDIVRGWHVGVVLERDPRRLL